MADSFMSEVKGKVELCMNTVGFTEVDGEAESSVTGDGVVVQYSLPMNRPSIVNNGDKVELSLGKEMLMEMLEFLVVVVVRRVVAVSLEMVASSWMESKVDETSLEIIESSVVQVSLNMVESSVAESKTVDISSVMVESL